MVSSRVFLKGGSFAILLILSLITPCGAEVAVSQPPEISARAHILMDPATFQVLTQNHADQRLPPASLTKLMTAYTVFQELRSGRIDLDSAVPVSRRAWRTGGSKMFINRGTEVRVEDLLRGLIIQSGNDAAIALAECVAGSVESFVDVMNLHGENLGLENSHWVNPTGLPALDHYSSARDLARLAAELIARFPEYYSYFSEKDFTYHPPGESPITQPNRNKLLSWDPSVDGVKTGYTASAGYCLVASARRDGMRLVSVVLGAERANGRFVAARSLLNWGFDSFERRRMYEAGRPLGRVRVWKGSRNGVDLGAVRDIDVTVPRGRGSQLTIETEISDEPVAPIGKNRILGKVIVSLQGEMLAERPLVTLQGVAEGSLWHRMIDSLRMRYR